jgi:glycosyltransferase involved in cell wall biosynthesis/O-antigen/teichoic acid export membrane protein
MVRATEKVLVYPRDYNPYQHLLYTALERTHPGRFRIRYCLRTPRSGPVAFFLIAPIARLFGYRTFHLHWLRFDVNSWPIPGRRRVSLWSALMAIHLLRLLRYHVIWTVHNVVPHEPTTSDDLRVSVALSESAGRCLVHSTSALQRMAELGMTTDRATVIPHPSYAARYEPFDDPLEARRRLGLDPDARLVLFLGHIRRYKGLEELIAAWDARSDRDAQLVVAGHEDDNAVGKLLARAHDDGILLYRPGYVSHENIPLYFAACDAVCLPYRNLTTSGAALLAITFGRPIIAPRLGSLRDLPDELGYFYDPADPAGLSRALACAVEASESDLQSRSAAAAREAAELTWERAAESLGAVYLDVIGRPDGDGVQLADQPAPARPVQQRRSMSRVAGGQLVSHWRDGLLRDSTWLIGITVITASFGYLFWLVAAHNYSSDSIGKAVAVVALINLASVFSEVGLRYDLVQHVGHTRERSAVRSIARSAFVLVLITSLVVAAVALVVVPFAEPNLKSTIFSPAGVTLVLVGVAISTMGQIVDYLMLALDLSKWSFLRNLIAGALRFALLAVGVVVLTRSANALVFVTIGSLAVSVLVSWLVVNANFPARSTETTASNGEAASPKLSVVALFRRSIRQHAITIGGFMPMFLAPLLVVARLGTSDAAYFGLSWAIASVALMVSPAVAGAVIAGVGRGAAMSQQVRRAAVYIAALVAIPMAVLAIFAHPILGLFGPAYAAHGTTLVRIVVLAVAVDAATNLKISVLRSQHRYSAASWLNTSMGVITVVVTWVLLPYLGIAACGVGFLVAQTLGAVWSALDRSNQRPDPPRVPGSSATVDSGATADVSATRSAQAVMVRTDQSG